MPSTFQADAPRPFSQLEILALAGQELLQQGQAFLDRGAVIEQRRRGPLLLARVQDTDFEPFETSALLDAAGLQQATCSCGGAADLPCPHLVALLLEWSALPDHFTVERSIADIVAPLDTDQLRDLVVQAAKALPIADAWFRRNLSRQPSASRLVPAVPARPLRIDALGIRQQVAKALGGSTRTRWGGTYAADNLEPLLNMAMQFVEQGDGRNALVVLREISRPLAESYEDHEGESEVSDFLDYSVGPLMAEAVLLARLNDTERAGIAAELSDWDEELEQGYGFTPFALARQALTTGWGDAVTHHDVDDGDLPPGPRFGPSLVQIQLRALEHSGDTDAYLARALAAGAHRERILKLIALGRIADASAALPDLAATADILDVARALREAGELDSAMLLAERGLANADDRGSLARWLAPVAQSLRPDLARRAWQHAFDAGPDFASFSGLEALTPSKSWPSLRTRLLKSATDSCLEHPAAGNSPVRYVSADDVVPLLLHTGEVAQAIRVVDAPWSYHSRRLVAAVADAAVADHPEWVIRTGMREAEAIINSGRSKDYLVAAEWLRRVRSAHERSESLTDWDGYLQAMRRQHSRKHSLVPLLDELRSDR